MSDTIEAETESKANEQRVSPAPILLAWTVELHSMTCVVFAATKAKAQWIATKSYWDAYGRRKGEWPRAKAWRAKPYDKSHLRLEKPRAWSEEHVMGL